MQKASLAPLRTIPNFYIGLYNMLIIIETAFKSDPFLLKTCIATYPPNLGEKPALILGLDKYLQLNTFFIPATEHQFVKEKIGDVLDDSKKLNIAIKMLNVLLDRTRVLMGLPMLPFIFCSDMQRATRADNKITLSDISTQTEWDQYQSHIEIVPKKKFPTTLCIAIFRQDSPDIEAYIKTQDIHGMPVALLKTSSGDLLDMGPTIQIITPLRKDLRGFFSNFCTSETWKSESDNYLRHVHERLVPHTIECTKLLNELLPDNCQLKVIEQEKTCIRLLSLEAIPHLMQGQDDIDKALSKFPKPSSNPKDENLNLPIQSFSLTSAFSPKERLKTSIEQIIQKYKGHAELKEICQDLQTSLDQPDLLKEKLQLPKDKPASLFNMANLIFQNYFIKNKKEVLTDNEKYLKTSLSKAIKEYSPPTKQATSSAKVTGQGETFSSSSSYQARPS